MRKPLDAYHTDPRVADQLVGLLGIEP